MLKVVWNVIKYFLGIVQNLLYPLKRLVCRRRKLSASDMVELTSIGSGDVPQMTSSVSGSAPQGNADLEMEAWDSWADNSGQGHGQQNHYYHGSGGGGDAGGHERSKANGQASRKASGHGLHSGMPQQEEEPEINFFEDMTPTVQRQKKFLIRKREMMAEQAPSSSRLNFASDVPLQTSELESWEDGNAWEDNAEATEDISWQAEEAIKEQRRRERLERQMEQQRKKQRKDEMRGLKGGSLAATKIS